MFQINSKGEKSLHNENMQQILNENKLIEDLNSRKDYEKIGFKKLFGQEIRFIL